MQVFGMVLLLLALVCSAGCAKNKKQETANAAANAAKVQTTDQKSKEGSEKSNAAAGEQKAPEAEATDETESAPEAEPERESENESEPEQAPAAEEGHTYTCDYFYLDVPSDWEEGSWSVNQTEDNQWEFRHDVIGPDGDTYASVLWIMVQTDPDQSSEFAQESIGTTSQGYPVYTGGAGGASTKQATITLR